MTKNDIITQTLAEMYREHEPNARTQSARDESAEYEDIVIATLRDQLPDDDLRTCGDFLALRAKCCNVCHQFYPHYDMYLETLPNGAKAWVCCSVRSALLGHN